MDGGAAEMDDNSNSDVEEVEICEDFDDGEDDYDENEENGNAELDDDALGTFDQHEEPVLCCAIGNTDKFFASGGQDDKGFVFDISCQKLFELKGHKDSLIAVQFNVNDKYVASGDMKGFVQVFLVETGGKVFEYELEDDLHWMKWHPVLEDVFLVGTDSGNIWIFKVNSNGRSKILYGKGSPCVCGIPAQNGKQAVVGYGNGSVCLWDLKTESCISTVKQVHKGSITSLDIHPNDRLAASASIDGTAALINLESSKVVHTYFCGKRDGAHPLLEDEEGAVESACFSRELPVIATGTSDGFVEVWDLSTDQRRNVCATDDAVSKLLFHNYHHHLLCASGLDGIMRAYDVRSGQCEIKRSGHSDQILDFALGKSSSILLTASEDTTCRLFDMNC